MRTSSPGFGIRSRAFLTIRLPIPLVIALAIPLPVVPAAAAQESPRPIARPRLERDVPIITGKQLTALNSRLNELVEPTLADLSAVYYSTHWLSHQFFPKKGSLPIARQALYAGLWNPILTQIAYEQVSAVCEALSPARPVGENIHFQSSASSNPLGNGVEHTLSQEPTCLAADSPLVKNRSCKTCRPSEALTSTEIPDLLKEFVRDFGRRSLLKGCAAQGGSKLAIPERVDSLSLQELESQVNFKHHSYIESLDRLQKLVCEIAFDPKLAWDFSKTLTEGEREKVFNPLPTVQALKGPPASPEQFAHRISRLESKLSRTGELQNRRSFESLLAWVKSHSAHPSILDVLTLLEQGLSMPVVAQPTNTSNSSRTFQEPLIQHLKNKIPGLTDEDLASAQKLGESLLPGGSRSSTSGLPVKFLYTVSGDPHSPATEKKRKWITALLDWTGRPVRVFASVPRTAKELSSQIDAALKTAPRTDSILVFHLFSLPGLQELNPKPEVLQLIRKLGSPTLKQWESPSLSQHTQITKLKAPIFHDIQHIQIIIFTNQF